jgi:tetratricopeptide (TPR) repeat protein
MRIYCNEDLGFSLNIPDDWSGPINLNSGTVLFDRAPVESLNIIVGPQAPEMLLEYTQQQFFHYANSKGYTDVEVGAIMVESKDHAWAGYDMGGGKRAKKYMLVFGGVEYAVTALCFDKRNFGEQEKQWDMIVQSFRLSAWRLHDMEIMVQHRTAVAGTLYQSAYDAASKGFYQEACRMLEKVLREIPDHIPAHKELAFILKNTGDVKGAQIHRQVMKRLDPSDQINRYNLAMIYFMLGSKAAAIKEMDELLSTQPGDKRYLETKRFFEA